MQPLLNQLGIYYWTWASAAVCLVIDNDICYKREEPRLCLLLVKGELCSSMSMPAGCFDPPCLADSTTIPSRLQDLHSLNNAVDLSTIGMGLLKFVT